MSTFVDSFVAHLNDSSSDVDGELAEIQKVKGALEEESDDLEYQLIVVKLVPGINAHDHLATLNGTRRNWILKVCFTTSWLSVNSSGVVARQDTYGRDEVFEAMELLEAAGDRSLEILNFRLCED
ncbi:hypothetical protein ACET3Z_021032 [Daucus carota]